MKRLIAHRKLKNTCVTCERQINKGDVYYKKRVVFAEDGIVRAWDAIECPKCYRQRMETEKRYVEFQKTCTHPNSFQDTHYTYIPGEAVMEPSHDYCLLCGKTL